MWADAPAAADPRTGFTGFGVGCSFDDNEVERAERTWLTEQASRGVMNQSKLESARSERRCDPERESELDPA